MSLAANLKYSLLYSTQNKKVGFWEGYSNMSLLFAYFLIVDYEIIIHKIL